MPRPVTCERGRPAPTRAAGLDPFHTEQEQPELVAVKIKLMRLGKIRQPYYRIVVADARTRRNGKAIETIGKYHPKAEPSLIEVDSERAQYWLGVGAQPTEPVQRILEVTGDWQKFKGLPGAEGTLKVAKAKPSKQELFNVALAEAGSEPLADATTPKKRAAPRKKDDASGEAAAASAPAEESEQA
jgi:small subunit ribosomal protein S16